LLPQQIACHVVRRLPLAACGALAAAPLTAERERRMTLLLPGRAASRVS
jgi:hypothetical protein